MTTFRDATAADLPAIVALLADDVLGSGREDASRMEPYRAALRAIEAQGGRVIVAVEEGAVEEGVVVGCLQIDLVANLSLGGMTRALVEGVRVAPALRGRGVGAALMREAVRIAQEGGAGMVQLTTNAARVDARRFYERLGFKGSHLGMKLTLG